jgi:hypothetical protein
MLLVALLLAGCLASLPEPRCPGADSPPQPRLSCQVAVEVAVASLPASHETIADLEFRYGPICPPDAACARPDGEDGTVIVSYNSGIQQSIFVHLEGDQVVVDPPAGFPPTS